jgi:hypothetical protein
VNGIAGAAMAGNSGTPLLKKLGIKEGNRVLLLRAPSAARRIERVCEGAIARFPGFDHFVCAIVAEFKKDFPGHQGSIKADGMIWAAWPKKASGIETDLTENAIRDTALKTHFVDVKVCAIDETWSGLKLVVRKEHRHSFGRELKRN